MTGILTIFFRNPEINLYVGLGMLLFSAVGPAYFPFIPSILVTGLFIYGLILVIVSVAQLKSRQGWK